jgi:hypothetical protein
MLCAYGSERILHVLTHNLVFFKYGIILFMNLTLLSWVWHDKEMFRRRRHATCMSVTR